MTKSIPPKSLVLYADDDQDDIELVKDAFKSYSQSIELKAFSNGEELLHYVKQLDPLEPSPCLIILDINMPRLDGKRTLSLLRNDQQFEDIPIVLFPTSTLPSEISFAKSFNAGFVTKPLHTEQIYMLVDKMIAHCTDDIKESFKKMKIK